MFEKLKNAKTQKMSKTVFSRVFVGSKKKRDLRVSLQVPPSGQIFNKQGGIWSEILWYLSLKKVYF